MTEDEAKTAAAAWKANDATMNFKGNRMSKKMKYVLVKAGFSTGETFDSVEELIKVPKYSAKTDSIYELGQQVEVKVETKVTYKNPVTRSLAPEDYEDVGNYRG